MPSLKRKTSHVSESGFSIYTGEEPKAGVYKADIISTKMKMSKNDNMYFNVFLKLVGNTGTKAEFNGWTGFCMVVLTDKDANIQRERNFYRSVGASEDPAVVYNPIEKGGEVTKIDGKKPDGKSVLVSIRYEVSNLTGANEPRINDILPLADASGPKSNLNDTSDDLVEEDDDLLEDDEEEMEEVDESDDEDDEDEESDALPRDQFESLSIVKLRKAVTEHFGDEISKDDMKGLSKDEILELLEEEGLITPF